MGKSVASEPSAMCSSVAARVSRKRGEIPVALRLEVFVDLPDAIGDVADHFGLWEIDGVDGGGIEVDVDNLAFAFLHKEGRLFDDIVADIDDNIGGLDRAVEEVSGGECSIAEEERVPLIDDAFAHFG